MLLENLYNLHRGAGNDWFFLLSQHCYAISNLPVMPCLLRNAAAWFVWPWAAAVQNSGGGDASTYRVLTSAAAAVPAQPWAEKARTDVRSNPYSLMGRIAGGIFRISFNTRSAIARML